MNSVLDIPLSEIYKEAFKRGLFDFITVTDKGKHQKQEEALKILTDDITEEFLYGGAAGGAKSWTGCAWLLFMSDIYPGTKWFIAREELKRITQSTLITFFKVASAYAMSNNFKFNAQKNVIVFNNGSSIDLLELKYLPSDPLFERFGSSEYTGGWIEEAGEAHFGAFEILKTRIGRHLNDHYKLLAKIFLSANPKKNWLYTTFYKAKLSPIQRYLSALVYDNPHIDAGYIERLKRTKDKSQKERLLNGNWDYDDDPTAMCSYDDIIAIFDNDHIQATGDIRIIADVARFGSDKARIAVLDGWVMLEHISFDISATTLIQDTINALRIKWGVPKKKCLADQDGVGGGVVDNCEILGFMNNGKPIKTKEAKENPLHPEKDEENYYNLQAQCAYGLAEKINVNEVYIKCYLSEQDKEDITTELQWLKTYKTDEDKKLRILPKEIVKQNIGRSPDWRDLLLMNYYFDLKVERSADFGW